MNERRAAREWIRVLFVGGIIALAVGISLAVAKQPSTTDEFGIEQKTGSEAGYAFGLVLAGVGYTLAMIAVIAWGVMLGNLASRES